MDTKYGFINGIEEAEYYTSGKIKSCRVTELNRIKTSLGEFIPQYETKDERRKVTGTLEFYENGDLMSICLDEQINLSTKFGVIPAEKILFYKGEKIKRVFPLNGKLSGYWGEENEYTLAREIELKISDRVIKSKFISIAFFENGSIKSLTFWPRERVEIETDFGRIKIRKGISFYEDGSVRSYEPAMEAKIKTPIGFISAFHNEVIGLNGDINSIEFYTDGKVKSLYTCSESIKIVNEKEEHVIEPQLKAGWCNELVKIPVPVKINFSDKLIVFDEKRGFELDKYNFFINNMNHKNIAEELTC